eukprot:2479653-Amphidinium_carterae.1
MTVWFLNSWLQADQCHDAHELRSNRYVVMAALNKEASVAHSVVSSALYPQVAFALDALALEYASPGFRNDPSVVMAAVCRNPDAFKFASDNLRKDPHIVTASTICQLIAISAKHPHVWRIEFKSALLQ